MARPKKLSSEVMLQILEDYYTERTAGNPGLLKYSLLEKYAHERGYADIKAYDFKRDKHVRDRLEELKSLCAEADGSRLILGTAYKSLDVTGIISRCRSKAELIEALTEMDRNWKVTHDAASEMQRKFYEGRASQAEMEARISELEQSQLSIEENLQSEKQRNRSLLEENRYLRKMLKTYLYPAIANQILLEEQALTSTGTSVTQIAMEELVDQPLPAPPAEITRSLSADRNHKSDVRSILSTMWEESE